MVPSIESWVKLAQTCACGGNALKHPNCASAARQDFSPSIESARKLRQKNWRHLWSNPGELPEEFGSRVAVTERCLAQQGAVGQVPEELASVGALY